MVTLPDEMRILRRPVAHKQSTMFRNVRYYRLDTAWPDSEKALSKELEKAGFTPCGPLTERSSGWEPVDSDAGNLLARRVNGTDLLKLRSQSRVLPPSVIKEELEVRIEEFRTRMQEAPSPREKRRMKAEARDELMPKAMLKSDRIWGYVDPKQKVVGIDTALESVAERFLRRLGAPFGGLVARPLQYKQPVSELLTGIFLGGAPSQFSLGRECRMKDAGDAHSTVRWSDFDLSDPTIRNHAASGMHLTHLGIVYDDIMSCVLDENGMVTKLRFLGMDDDIEDHKEPLARLDAEFVLITGTLQKMLGDLKKALGGFA
jgi:recombination associated protein RdgC